MVQDEWGGFQKDLYQGEEKKGRHPPAFLRHMGSRLHAETGCRKVYVGEVSEWQKNPMAAKETTGDGGGRSYAISQFSDQNRQDAISRVSAVKNSARGPRCEHWRSGGWKTRSHQLCRLRRNGNNSSSFPLLHLKAPVWQHARCTKAKEQAQVCHAWQKKRRVARLLLLRDTQGQDIMGDLYVCVCASMCWMSAPLLVTLKAQLHATSTRASFLEFKSTHT